MTLNEEINICANQLANEGKKPTIALIKAKLSQRAPLTAIITALKNWQHQPEFIAPISDKEFVSSSKATESKHSELIKELIESDSIKKVIEQSLKQELTSLREELSEMKLLITDLSEQLNGRK
jgi:hypothetical protein